MLLQTQSWKKLNLPHITITTRKIKSMLRPLLMLIFVLLSACTPMSKETGFIKIQKNIESKLDKKVYWYRNGRREENSELSKRINVMLSKPLNVDSTVQIALLGGCPKTHLSANSALKMV
ncbi:MAG: hypothetical protein HON94_06475, partial [Methylococcales bacterium]|nr:hypothetical protein [Methylococcales bacterium]